jgi:hypothetical protein
MWEVSVEGEEEEEVMMEPTSYTINCPQMHHLHLTTAAKWND